MNFGIKADDKIKTIPMNWMPAKFFTFTLEGWNKFTVVGDDTNFLEMITMANKIYKSFVSIYQKTHAFTDPQLSWAPDGLCKIKIAIMPIDEYEMRIEQEKKKNVR